MNILKHGEVVICRNIRFEDNKIDVKMGHPAIIILPTSEYEDEAYCLYMTSNKKRAKREQEKYTRFEGNLPKESYVNLQKIVKKENRMEKLLTILSDEEFLDLIKRFYNYQTSIHPINNEFRNIQKQVKTLIELLEIDSELEVDDSDINRKIIEILSNYDDEKRKGTVYKVYLESKNQINNEQLQKLEEDRYAKKLIETYKKIQNLSLKNINISDPNNKLREEYIKFKNNNYLTNVDMIFNDILALLKCDEKSNTEKSKILSEFINFEEKRALEQKQKKQQKVQRNYGNKIIEAQNKSKYKKYEKMDETFTR